MTHRNRPLPLGRGTREGPRVLSTTWRRYEDGGPLQRPPGPLLLPRRRLRAPLPRASRLGADDPVRLGLLGLAVLRDPRPEARCGMKWLTIALLVWIAVSTSVVAWRGRS